MTELDEYWNNFLLATNRNLEEKCSGDLFFESKGFREAELISLILSEKKTALFTSFATFSIDGEPLPVSGELYLVVNKQNQPICVIEFESVQIIPYNEVTWEMAKQEGEDQNLEEWRQKEQEILEDEGAVVGFEFTPQIKLVYQSFKVIYK